MCAWAKAGRACVGPMPGLCAWGAKAGRLSGPCLVESNACRQFGADAGREWPRRKPIAVAHERQDLPWCVWVREVGGWLGALDMHVHDACVRVACERAWA